MSRRKVVTFKVVFEPESDGGGWNVSIPSVQGCHTYGRSLSEARDHLREALACCADKFDDPDAVARAAVFEEEIRLPAAVRAAVRRFQKAREKAKAEAAKVRSASSDAARTITETLSLRDAGELLGLSQEAVRKVLKTG